MAASTNTTASLFLDSVPRHRIARPGKWPRARPDDPSWDSKVNGSPPASLSRQESEERIAQKQQEACNGESRVDALALSQRAKAKVCQKWSQHPPSRPAGKPWPALNAPFPRELRAQFGKRPRLPQGTPAKAGVLHSHTCQAGRTLSIQAGKRRRLVDRLAGRCRCGCGSHAMLHCTARADGRPRRCRPLPCVPVRAVIVDEMDGVLMVVTL